MTIITIITIITITNITSSIHGGPLSTAYDKPGYSISYYDILCCYIYIFVHVIHYILE